MDGKVKPSEQWNNTRQQFVFVPIDLPQFCGANTRRQPGVLLLMVHFINFPAENTFPMVDF